MISSLHRKPIFVKDYYGAHIEAIVASSRSPGFLFDMNIFFQRLLSMFLLENLTSARIEDQWRSGTCLPMH